ncbi:MAG: endonuclease/exonuclease/phosphatase family protein [Gammaproteobacteria bacterium]|nr:endonuclease/exonuclease/phosphatase family protein [Gammaproteobacteria bacterium]
MRYNLHVVLLSLILICSTPYAAAEPGTLQVVTQNLNRFYDDHQDGQKEIVYSSRKYQQRLLKLAQKIATEFNFADVIAFQEVENRTVLLQLSRLIKQTYDQHYNVVLQEGNDVSGIDVGFLIHSKLPIKAVQSLFKNKLSQNKGGKLFSRPPLLVKVCPSHCITFVNVHLRSMRGLNTNQRQQRIMLKRQSQAETLARWIQQFQSRNPQESLVILGDFNALTPSDAYVDVIGTIIGKPDQTRPQLKSRDLVSRDLIDLSLRVPAALRYSYRYRGKNQLLDYALVSDNLADKVSDVSFSQINYAFSDHAALKLNLTIP